MGEIIAIASVPWLIWLVSRQPLAKEKPNIRKALILIIVVHCLASLVNAHVTILPGGDADALSFHRRAERGQLDYYQAGAGRYVKSLHKAYSFLGASKFLGQQLSVVAFTLSCFLLLDIMVKLQLRDLAPAILKVFGLLPAIVLFTSMTMREAFLIFLVIAAVHWVLKIAYDDSVLGYPLVALCCFLMASLHKAMVPFSIILLAASGMFLFLSAGSRRVHPVFIVIQLFLAVGLLFAGFAQKEAFSESSVVLSALDEGKTEDLVGHYREAEGRASYSVSLDLSSAGGMVRTGPAVFFLYMFAPLPWQVETLFDLYGCIESFLRLALCFGTVIFLAQAKGNRRLIAFYLVSLFLAMEMIWAAGTSNWGTAVRHHTTVYFVLAILGTPSWIGQSGDADTNQRTGRRGGSRRERVKRARQKLKRVQSSPPTATANSEVRPNRSKRGRR